MADLMTVGETATYLRVQVKTLHNWRTRRVGPPAVKVVGGLRYSRTDVDRWLAAERDTADARGGTR